MSDLNTKLKCNKKLKMLHIASFQGNVGDIINHEGFYSNFKKYITKNVTFDQLEMRKFYRCNNELTFDQSFVELANSYDMLILGGGGFFDLKWDYSCTGTTIDINKSIRDSIKIPVLINSMGYHEYSDVPEICKVNFNDFLSDIVKRDNWLITVRNDGSLNRLRSSYGFNLTKSINMVPDAGFFFSDHNVKRKMNISNSQTIGFNISCDLFSPEFNGNLTEELFISKMGFVINDYLQSNRNSNIMFFPHTPQDIAVLSKIFCVLKEAYLRTRITIAPFSVRDSESANILNEYYNDCDLIIAMRFHSNILGIQNRIPTIGLAGHQQICGLYKDLNAEKYCIPLSNKCALDNLNKRIDELLNNKIEYGLFFDKILFELNEDARNYYSEILNKFFI